MRLVRSMTPRISPVSGSCMGAAAQRPCLHGLVEVLGGEDLDGVVGRQRRADRVRAGAALAPQRRPRRSSSRPRRRGGPARCRRSTAAALALADDHEVPASSGHAARHCGTAGQAGRAGGPPTGPRSRRCRDAPARGARATCRPLRRESASTSRRSGTARRPVVAVADEPLPGTSQLTRPLAAASWPSMASQLFIALVRPLVRPQPLPYSGRGRTTADRPLQRRCSARGGPSPPEVAPRDRPRGEPSVMAVTEVRRPGSGHSTARACCRCCAFLLEHPQGVRADEVARSARAPRPRTTSSRLPLRRGLRGAVEGGLYRPLPAPPTPRPATAQDARRRA